VFGAGGGTSSYEETHAADVIVLWGSNARETHPIFFHHILKGVRNGAKLYVVDPRRTSSARWGHQWLGLDVGTDIALAHAVGREIIAAGLCHREFVARATTGFDAYRSMVESYTLDRAESITKVPAGLIRDLAHAYARAGKAQLCWTLGITEHHNAVDNVTALINLSLLTGHVGRAGSGLCPLRGQNNVQGGGDMGAIPNRLPGGQDVEDPEARRRWQQLWGGTEIPPRRGRHLSQMFEAMEHRQMKAAYVIGENPADSEADRNRVGRLFDGLDCLIVQDLFMTGTGAKAHVVFPAAASWCESEGTVTSSERRVQRVRKALSPPGEARDDISILCDLARRLGRDLGNPSPQELWDELRTLSDWHRGMSYERLEKLGGIAWPCPDETHPGSAFLHGRLWKNPVEGPRAPFSLSSFEPPVDELTEDFPLRLTTGRRLESFNTGVQTAAYRSPLRRGESLDLSPEDGKRYGVSDGERVRIRSRRGSVEAPVRYDDSLRPGLAFMTFHFPDQVATNVLTIDATDPKSGTAEFKASAIRIEKL
jgi:formate dehydrogenase major subunit